MTAGFRVIPTLGDRIPDLLDRARKDRSVNQTIGFHLAKLLGQDLLAHPRKQSPRGALLVQLTSGSPN